MKIPRRTCSRCHTAKDRSAFSGLARICRACGMVKNIADMREERKCLRCGEWKLKRENFSYRARICHNCRIPIRILSNDGKTIVGILPNHQLHFTLEHKGDLILYHSGPPETSEPQASDIHRPIVADGRTCLIIERHASTVNLPAADPSPLNRRETWSLNATLSTLRSEKPS